MSQHFDLPRHPEEVLVLTELAPPEDVLVLTELAPPEKSRTTWRERMIAIAVGGVLGTALALAPDLIEDDGCIACEWASAAPGAGTAPVPIPDIESVERTDVRSAALTALIVRARTALSTGDLDTARWYLDSAERLGVEADGLGDMRRLLDLLRTLPRDA